MLSENRIFPCFADKGIDTFAKNTLLTTLEIWNKEFYIEVDITLLKSPTSTSYYSVFHFTQGGNKKSDGSRAPAVSLTKNKLYVFANIGNNNYYHKSYKLTKGLKTHVVVKQYKSNNNKYYFEVWFNNVRKLIVENKKPTDFPNMKVYTGDPWHGTPPQDVSYKIENFKYGTKGDKVS